MRFVKFIAVGSLLLGLMGTAYAEGGFERAKSFTEDFRAEQARLWGDQSEKRMGKMHSNRKSPKNARKSPTTNRNGAGLLMTILTNKKPGSCLAF